MQKNIHTLAEDFLSAHAIHIEDILTMLKGFKDSRFDEFNGMIDELKRIGHGGVNPDKKLILEGKRVLDGIRSVDQDGAMQLRHTLADVERIEGMKEAQREKWRAKGYDPDSPRIKSLVDLTEDAFSHSKHALDEHADSTLAMQADLLKILRAIERSVGIGQKQ